MGLSDELLCEAGSISHQYNPHRFFTSRCFESLVFRAETQGFHGLSLTPVLPGLSACVCGTAQFTNHHLAFPVHDLALSHILSSRATRLCPSYQSGWIFLFLLGCWASILMISWQLWLFIVFKLVVILVLIVGGSEAFLPMPPSWLEAPNDNHSDRCEVSSHCHLDLHLSDN